MPKVMADSAGAALCAKADERGSDLRVTYVATNRAHHYPYAIELDRAGALEAFISGFCRWSPRASLPELGSKLIRKDLLQTLYVLSLRARLPEVMNHSLNRLSNRHLDRAAIEYARRSNVFLYYRTTGANTAARLKREKANVLCVLEEVNSHVSRCHSILKQEFEKLGKSGVAESFPDYSQRLEAYDGADFILCPSEWVVRSFIEQGFPREKLLKNPYGFQSPGNLAESDRPHEQNADMFRILFVGQLHFRKGLRYLIEAFRLLKHPRKELVLVGPKTSLTGLEGVSIPDGVRFAGILKGQELAHEYRQANVFCLPTLEEGLALVLGEALSFGLPILATNQSGAEDLFEDGQEGFIVQAGDSHALWEKLSLWTDEPQKLEAMSHTARNRAVSLGGWAASGEGLVATLRSAWQTMPRLQIDLD